MNNNSQQTTLVLASSSPRRQELIRFLNLPVVVQSSEADETVPEEWNPARIVEELSLRKARAVAETLTKEASGRSVIIGSDTIVVLDGQVLGKPADAEDAKRMLRMLQGRGHVVYSGVACLKAGPGWKEPTSTGSASGSALMSGKLGDHGHYHVTSESPNGDAEIIIGHTASKVIFRPMDDEEIAAYVESGEPLDKAGAYGVQGFGALFIEKIEGDFYSVMGLPLNLLYLMLLKCGISPLGKKDV